MHTTPDRILALLLLLAAAPVRAEPINAVVGDQSWIERYGRPPSEEDDRLRDAERHRVHLEWIERRLRARDVSHLAPELRARRATLLDALADYRQRGEKPVNEHYRERHPRFIDDQGRICAVGYLIEVSAGRELAEHIDAHYEHDYLLDISDARLNAWIASSGFTAKELASIQPSYAGSEDPFFEGLVWSYPALAMLAADVAMLIYDAEGALEGQPLADPFAGFQLGLGLAMTAPLVGLWIDVLDGDVTAVGVVVASVLTVLNAFVVGIAIDALVPEPRTSSGATRVVGAL